MYLLQKGDYAKNCNIVKWMRAPSLGRQILNLPHYVVVPHTTVTLHVASFAVLLLLLLLLVVEILCADIV